MLGKFLCWLSLHEWKQHAPPKNKREAKISGREWTVYTKTCLRCDRREYWLPGCGGSELGCWLFDKRRPVGD